MRNFNPKNICIIRLSALGDVTHVLPVINALRQAIPGCKITWIIGSVEKRLLGNLQDIDFIVFNKKRGWLEYLRMYALLKHRQFDALLHMQLSLRANLIAALVKARVKIGFDYQRAKEGHSLVVNKRIAYQTNQHVLDALFSFLPMLEVDIKNIDYSLPISDSTREAVSQILPKQRPYVVISPASIHSLRNWSVEGYAKVADHLINKFGVSVVLSGGKTKIEYELGEAIESAMRQKAYNLIGKDTIEQLAAILEQALFLISPDSGPAHIANAVGTPVLGLYAATDSHRSGPYHSRDYCVDHYAEAAEKFLGKAANQLKWGQKIEIPGVMDLIKTDEVIEQVDKLMSQFSPEQVAFGRE